MVIHILVADAPVEIVEAAEETQQGNKTKVLLYVKGRNMKMYERNLDAVVFYNK